MSFPVGNADGVMNDRTFAHALKHSVARDKAEIVDEGTSSRGMATTLLQPKAEESETYTYSSQPKPIQQRKKYR